MENYEAIIVLRDLRDNLQHNYKMYQQQIEMKDREITLMSLSKKISALTIALGYLEERTPQ